MKFETVLKNATSNPEQVDFFELLDTLEQYLADAGHYDVLSIAGTMLMHLTDIYVKRAEHFLNSWEENYCVSDTEPVITDDMLASFLRQTMSLDLDSMMDGNGCVARSPSEPDGVSDESVAGTVDKEVLLDVIDEMEVRQHALAIAHDESVSEWAQIISQWMHNHQQGAYLRDIVSALTKTNAKMTLVKVWLGLLLGGYRLEQRGSFYEIETIWVQR